MDTEVCLVLLLLCAPFVSMDCSNCNHLDIEYIKMPDSLKDLFEQNLPFDPLNDQSCIENTALKQTCERATEGVLNVCDNLTYHLTAIGMKDNPLFSEIGMKITVVSRRCSVAPLDAIDYCRSTNDISDIVKIDENMNATSVLQGIQSLDIVFSSVTHDGIFCSSPTDVSSNSRSTPSNKAHDVTTTIQTATIASHLGNETTRALTNSVLIMSVSLSSTVMLLILSYTCAIVKPLQVLI